MNSRYLKNIILLVFSMLFVGCCGARKPLPDIVGKTDKCEPKWFDSKTSEYGRDYYAYGVYSHPLRMQARMMAEGSGRMALAAELKTQIKAKFGGSSAGHNGISSIDKFIGKDYSRVRIGIGKPNGKANVVNHVLKDFDEEEKTELENITKSITNSLSILLDKKLDLFSSTVNNK